MTIATPIDQDLDEDIRDPALAGDRDSFDGRNPRSMPTRQAIMSAARASFLRHGISGTRLAAVARDAWFAPSTVSLHFKGKEALFQACLEEDVDLLFGGVERMVREHPFPMITGDYSLLLGLSMGRYPLLRSVMLRSPGRWGHVFYDSPHLVSARQRMTNEIRRGQLAGFIREDLDATVLGHSLASLATTAIWPIGQESVTADQQVREVVAVVWMSLFHPVSGVQDIINVVRPWRLDHLELPLDLNYQSLQAYLQPVAL